MTLTMRTNDYYDVNADELKNFIVHFEDKYVDVNDDYVNIFTETT